MALTDLTLSSRAGDPRGGLLSLAGDERRRDPLLSLRGERLLSLSLLGERLLQKRESGVQDCYPLPGGGKVGAGGRCLLCPPILWSGLYALSGEDQNVSAIDPTILSTSKSFPLLSLYLSLYMYIYVYLAQTNTHYLPRPSDERANHVPAITRGSSTFKRYTVQGQASCLARITTSSFYLRGERLLLGERLRLGERRGERERLRS